MAGKVVSIEIGYLVTKVCEVDYQAKNPKVYSSFSIPTSVNVLNDGTVTVIPEFTERLRNALAKNKIKSKQVIFTISSTKIATRNVTIPFVKEKQIIDVVKANAKDYFPVDITKYQLGYSIQRIVGDGKTKQYELLVLAAPLGLVKSYYDLAADLKLEIVGLDYIGNSLFQLLKDDCAEGENLIIKVDEGTSYVMVIKNGAISFIRNISYGVLEALQEIMDSGKWGVATTPDKALEIANKENVLGDEEIARALAQLNSSIARILDYYSSQNSNSDFKKVYLTGIGADFFGMDELLSEHINKPVELVGSSEGIGYASLFNKDDYNQYLPALGSTISPANLKIEEVKKTDGSSGAVSGGIDLIPIAIVVLILGLIAGGALTAFAFINNNKAKAESKKLEREIENLEGVVDIAREYQETKLEYNQVKSMYISTQNKNESLLEFFDEMESKMPSSICVTSFTADQEGVSVTMKVNNKSEAAAAIQQFRTFKSIRPTSITAPTISTEFDEDEETMLWVEFTMSGKYRPVYERIENMEGEEEGDDL